MQQVYAEYFQLFLLSTSNKDPFKLVHVEEKGNQDFMEIQKLKQEIGFEFKLILETLDAEIQ